MRILNLSSLLFLPLLLLCIIFSTSTSHAQDSKPKLVEIILNEETNDPKALEIVQSLVKAEMQKQAINYELGTIRAKYVPLQKNNSNKKFIYSIFYDPPAGGCYASGCLTVIYTNSLNRPNSWKAVFAAYVHKSWYDETSKKDRNANLIFSSSLDGNNPGVWMWNGQDYRIVRRR